MGNRTDEYITARELALMARTRTRTIERLVYLELVRPVKKEPELQFKSDVVPQIRRMLRLHVELGVGWTSMDVVLKLLDRVERLEQQRDPSSS